MLRAPNLRRREAEQLVCCTTDPGAEERGIAVRVVQTFRMLPKTTAPCVIPAVSTLATRRSPVARTGDRYCSVGRA